MSNSPLKTLLTQTQTDILFGEALANPDDQRFPLGEVEIVEAVQRFLKDRDRCAKLVEVLEAENEDLKLRAPMPVEYYDNIIGKLEDELECRKSHTDTEIGELKAEIEVLQESLKIVKDENQVNKKNLFAKIEQLESKDETIAFGRKQLTGVIDRLSDASELLNNLGYTFDEDTETWEEKEKVECVEKTFYFSSDEGGYTFYEDTDSLIKNTPRIEDCYVFVGDTTKEKIEEDSENYREVDVIEYLADKKKEQKEKVEERRVQTGGEVGADGEDSEPVGAWRIYCGSDAYKIGLPCEEEFFETLTEAKESIDEINKEGGIQLSYATIDYEWYGKSWVKKESDSEE